MLRRASFALCLLPIWLCAGHALAGPPAAKTEPDAAKAEPKKAEPKKAEAKKAEPKKSQKRADKKRAQRRKASPRKAKTAPRKAAPVKASKDIQCVAVREANFRTGPSIKHDVAFTAIKLYPVKILKRQSGWVEVEDFEGDRAWIARRLLSSDPTVVVSVDNANLREKPTTKSDVVDKAERAQVFRVLEREGDWLKLSADDGERGWIRNDLVWGD